MKNKISDSFFWQCTIDNNILINLHEINWQKYYENSATKIVHLNFNPLTTGMFTQNKSTSIISSVYIPVAANQQKESKQWVKDK